MSSTPPPPGPPPPGPPPDDEPSGQPSGPSAGPPAYGATGPQQDLAALGTETEVPYHRIHRIGAWGPAGWWRALVGVLVALAGGFLVLPLVVLLAFWVGLLVVGDGGATTSLERIIDTDDVTPLVLAYLNVSLASVIAVTWFVTRVLHGLKPRWLASVAPRIRWRWFTVTLGLSVVALLATVVVSALLPAQAEGVVTSGEVNSFTSTTRDFLLVIVLLTPLQAAGEEYLFRGYLTQALGSIVRWPRVSLVVAVVVPSVLFALAHGAQDAPVFIDRLAFGLVAGVLTIATGGLEAAIAMHVLNNWLAFGLSLAFGDITSALNPTGGTWWSLPVTLTQSLVYLGLAVWVARAMGIATRTAPGAGRRPRGVLEGPGPRV